MCLAFNLEGQNALRVDSAHSVEPSSRVCTGVARRALGCILVELLTGKKAFDGSTLPAVVMKIIQGSPPSLPEVYTTQTTPINSSHAQL